MDSTFKVSRALISSASLLAYREAPRPNGCGALITSSSSLDPRLFQLVERRQLSNKALRFLSFQRSTTSRQSKSVPPSRFPQSMMCRLSRKYLRLKSALPLTSPRSMKSQQSTSVLPLRFPRSMKSQQSTSVLPLRFPQSMMCRLLTKYQQLKKCPRLMLAPPSRSPQSMTCRQSTRCWRRLRGPHNR